MVAFENVDTLPSRVAYPVDMDVVTASLEAPVKSDDSVAGDRTRRTMRAVMAGKNAIQGEVIWSGEHVVTNSDPLEISLPYDIRQEITLTFAGTLAAGGTGENMLLALRLLDEHGDLVTSIHPDAAQIGGTWTHYAGGGFYKYCQVNTDVSMAIPAGMTVSEAVIYPWAGNSGLAEVTSVELSGALAIV